MGVSRPGGGAGSGGVSRSNRFGFGGVVAVGEGAGDDWGEARREKKGKGEGQREIFDSEEKVDEDETVTREPQDSHGIGSGGEGNVGTLLIEEEWEKEGRTSQLSVFRSRKAVSAWRGKKDCEDI